MPPTPSESVDQNIEAVAALYEKAEHELPPDQRGIERLVTKLGQPRFLYTYLVLIGLWVMGNLLSRTLGVEPVDVPPFFWLQGSVTASSLLMTIVILIAQNRQNRVADRRAQLDLQINLLAERKIAKVIELLQEMRRDNPSMRDRTDTVADAMALPADPKKVVRALDERGGRPDVE